MVTEREAATGKAVPVSDAEYRALAGFRRSLRSFLYFSEESAREVGLTPAQHQLLVAIRGTPDGSAPSITEVADALKLRHHSAVELVDRAERSGLVTRSPDPLDGRRQRLRLTLGGEEKLAVLAALHREELRRFRRDSLAHLDALG